MELYVLDDNLKPSDIINSYESVIWTERFANYGDFRLTIASSNESRTLLQPGTMIAKSDTNRIMTVETVFNEIKDGKNMLSISGSSLEKILFDRFAKESNATLTIDPDWAVKSEPEILAHQIVNEICRLGRVYSTDIIPELTNCAFVEGSLGRYGSEVDLVIKPTTVFEVVKTLADTYGFGFRIFKHADGTLKFNSYTGNDRTSNQTSLPAIIFSPNFDNLQNIAELISIDGNKNVAVAFSMFGVETEYALGTDATSSGLRRRVMYVDASDVTLTAGAQLTSVLKQRAREALAQQRPIFGFDGEVPVNSQYKYRVDYFLGDLVEFQNTDGTTSQMKVTENIHIVDAEGERSYPTLSTETIITPGSWLAWDSLEIWDDAIGVWDDY